MLPAWRCRELCATTGVIRYVHVAAMAVKRAACRGWRPGPEVRPHLDMCVRARVRVLQRCPGRPPSRAGLLGGRPRPGGPRAPPGGGSADSQFQLQHLAACACSCSPCLACAGRGHRQGGHVRPEAARSLSRPAPPNDHALALHLLLPALHHLLAQTPLVVLIAALLGGAWCAQSAAIAVNLSSYSMIS